MAWRSEAPAAKPFILSGASAFDEGARFLRQSRRALHSQRGQHAQERLMSKKPVVRKQSKKIADSRRVRYGSGFAPRVVRATDAATRDSRAIRFGSGFTPAALRK